MCVCVFARVFSLLDVSDFFLCSEEGKGESEATGRGGRSLFENSRKGEVSQEAGGCDIVWVEFWVGGRG